jgi:hypothetical protein
MKIGATPGASPTARPAAVKPAGGGGRRFVDVLRAADREVRPRGPAGPAPPTTKPTTEPTSKSSTSAPASAPRPADAPSPVARNLTRALDNINKGEARVDALLEAAAKGKTFSAGELIALQATVFKYSQTVEVLSRATDKLVGALKQTLGTQV